MILAFKIGFLSVRFIDLVDILLVSFLLYHVYKLMRGSVAVRVFLGFLVLYLLYLVVKAANMELLTSILGQFMGVGVIAVIILFQQEIRKFLLLIGKTPFFERDGFIKNIFNRNSPDEESIRITPIIVEASKTLGGTNTGALIVFSRNSELKFYAESGDEIDAKVSKRLIQAIFNKNSPLHDGAVIVYKGKIKAARCILPVTERDNLPAQFGLRHRAAIGMSEATDTLILVVSEETGQMSIARNGQLIHNMSGQELRKKINDYLYETDDTATKDKQNASLITQKEKTASSEITKSKVSETTVT